MARYRIGKHSLRPRLTRGASIQIDDHYWRLEIPAGPAGSYRLAQLDDTQGLTRRAFMHQAPFLLELKARASHSQLPGTWGFGLWNDPFGLSLPGSAGGLWLPALPNAAWFFHASEQNYLTLEDDQPGFGWLAAVFQRSLRHLPDGPNRFSSNQTRSSISGSGLGRLVRRWGRFFVHQDSVRLDVDTCDWHTYRLDWQADRLRFWVENDLMLETLVVPRGRLGLVIWIDNQFMSFRPDGRLQSGTQENSEPAWIEIICD
jgi:hypothetical protein